MSTPVFHQLDLKTFQLALQRFPFRRRIDSVHLHHTWRPSHADYRGHETLLAMWRYHTQEMGWSDIAQHLTIAPDGTIWTGRNWNRPPASARGFNGNAEVGPFMIEMIGDFDRGRDRLEGNQREVALEVVARIQAHFGLDEQSLRFHSTMSAKSCPGTSMVYKDLIKELREYRSQLKTAPASVSAARELRPFSDQYLEVQRVIDDLARKDEAGAARAEEAETANAELPESGVPLMIGPGVEREARFGISITPELLADLAPHVVNLSQGRFSESGRLRTTPGDVDAIFFEHLPRQLEAAKAEKRPLKLVFYAHGGLVRESSGIAIAHKHLAWWRANKVYPINFIWETGLSETLRQLLFGSQRALMEMGIRDVRAAFTDRIIEELVHEPGEKIWSGMKFAAERSVDVDGGAHYVAQRLQEFCVQHGDSVELHAVGHSAGSIFHSHFIPTALDLHVPAFKTAHFLAPAITIEAFIRRLNERLGQDGLRHLTLFTMNKAYELDDNVAAIYRKSLLYLIYYALEREGRTPILGLEESLRDDPATRRTFGLDGSSSAVGEVVWSVTSADSGRSASQAAAHGGFDDDPATMNSVLRRVLDVADSVPIKGYQDFHRAIPPLAELEAWMQREELPTEIAALLQPAPPPGPAGSPTPVSTQPAAPEGGRRRAICVGIDRYTEAPLYGCVADARLWAQTLTQLGFEPPELILDGQATRSAILGALERLVKEGRPGDLLVFQYSGHGTQLPDLDGDEVDSKDEALCSFDYPSGAFVIDDDLAAVFANIGEEINFTCFIDCCHSGTGTRLAAGGPAGRPADPTARRRYLPATPAMEQAHGEFRRRLGMSRTGGHRTQVQMKEVTFSACQPYEVAWESQGQGDFTRHANRILSAGLQGLTHAGFQQQLEAAFGSQGRQRPLLDCAPDAKQRPLLQPLRAAQEGGQDRGMMTAASTSLRANEVAQLLQSIAGLLAKG